MPKALILDRDGVINVEKNYLYRPEDFEFVPGIFELCQTAQEQGYLLIVVTNQAGIARGLYTEDDYQILTSWMIGELAKRDIQIARVYFCPYHPVHGVGRYKYDSPDRKPKPGMILKAQADFDLDLASCILVGDQITDVQAGAAAGVGTLFLFRSEARPEAMPTEVTRVDSLDFIRQKIETRESIPCDL